MFRSRLPVAVFAAVTLFIRVVRLRILAGDPGASWRLFWTLLSVAMGVAAVALGASWLAGARRGTWWVGTGPLVKGLAAVTFAVWIPQVVTIVAEWKSPGFVIVHVILAVVSMVSAVWAVRSLRRSGAVGNPSDSDLPPGDHQRLKEAIG